MFVKICGITTEEDALLAVALGADALGFIFAPGSPRRVSPSQARDIVSRLPKEAVTVGVFKDERPERVVEIVNKAKIKGAQLCGREPVSELKWIRRRLPFVIQAFRAGDKALEKAGDSPADIVMVDSLKPGSGEVFDWSICDGIPSGLHLMLAGGLTPENVGDAIERVRPWGVDVATGVESAPGKKDSAKMKHFIDAAVAAGELLEEAAGEGIREPGEPGAVFDWEEDEILNG